MLTTPSPVAFAYTRAELEALFRLTHAEDIERDGCYDARSAAINQLSHHWQHPATREASQILGTFYFHWEPTPRLYEIESQEGFALEVLMQVLGRLELQALGFMKHGDVPREAG